MLAKVIQVLKQIIYRNHKILHQSKITISQQLRNNKFLNHGMI